MLGVLDIPFPILFTNNTGQFTQPQHQLYRVSYGKTISASHDRDEDDLPEGVVLMVVGSVPIDQVAFAGYTGASGSGTLVVSRRWQVAPPSPQGHCGPAEWKLGALSAHGPVLCIVPQPRPYAPFCIVHCGLPTERTPRCATRAWGMLRFAL